MRELQRANATFGEVRDAVVGTLDAADSDDIVVLSFAVHGSADGSLVAFDSSRKRVSQRVAASAGVLDRLTSGHSAPDLLQHVGIKGPRRKLVTGRNLQRVLDPLDGLFERAGIGSGKSRALLLMMSPMSVAQYLELGRHRFDLLVIDEASQMRPEDALGAMLRCNQAVIVGDPEQTVRQLSRKEEGNLAFSVRHQAEAVLIDRHIKSLVDSQYFSDPCCMSRQNLRPKSVAVYPIAIAGVT